VSAGVGNEQSNYYKGDHETRKTGRNRGRDVLCPNGGTEMRNRITRNE